jgi:hypothetical protein
VATERQAELLLGEGRHPEADRIERELLAQGKSPEQARRATVLGRPIEHNRSPKTDKAEECTLHTLAGLRPHVPAPADGPPRVGADGRRAPPVLELCQDIPRDKTLAWLEELVAEIRWKAGGKRRARVKDGLIVAVFRHYESRATESRPLLHDHAFVSIRSRRPDEAGTWGNLSADSLMTHIVAADTLYLLYFVAEVTARLGWAWEPREVVPGRRPVMDIAGIGRRLIGWQSTRRQQIEDALPVFTAKYEERQGHAPGERASYALACQAADQTRPPKRTELLSLTELRTRWRSSVIRAFGACTVYQLAERARAAAAAVWAGAAGGRRRVGGRRRRRRGVRDARRVQTPPPARRSPPPPLLRPARPTTPTRPGRTDRADRRPAPRSGAATPGDVRRISAAGCRGRGWTPRGGGRAAPGP